MSITTFIIFKITLLTHQERLNGLQIKIFGDHCSKSHKYENIYIALTYICYNNYILLLKCYTHKKSCIGFLLL